MNYTIQNNQISISINSLGAELQSLQLISSNHEYLWQGNVDYWSGRAPILFPIVGGLKNKEYLWKGKKYSLPNHGISRINEFSLIKQSETELQFVFISNEETQKMYPFSFELLVSYRIQGNKIDISYIITNTSSEEMPFVFGLHPAFNLDDKLEHTWIELENEPLISNVDTQDGFIISQSKNYGQGSLRFHAQSFEQNDTIIFDNLRSRKATLRFQGSDRAVAMSWGDELPILAFWSKAGSSFVCIEPWCGWADQAEDTVNELSHKKGMLLLPPHQQKEFRYSIELL